MRILVLGAGGFIGSNLTEHLLAATDHRVPALDDDDEKVLDVRNTAGRLAFYPCDIRQNQALVSRLVGEADLLIDLIAYANPSVYVSRPLEVVELNFFQNLRLVEECIRQQKRLIQFSTCEVCGMSAGQREPFCEDTTNLTLGPVRNQRWIYACAKELLERIIYAHGQQGSLDFTIVRPFNFVGPKIDYLVKSETMGGPRVFPHFLGALLQGGPLRLVDGGHAHRSYTHISDAVRAIQLVTDRPDACHNEIINIGNPANGTTIRALAHLMREVFEEVTGRPAASPIEDIVGAQFYGPGYQDCDWRIPNVDKIRALGWVPRLDLRQTFRETIVWYLTRIASSPPSELPSYLRRGVPAPSLGTAAAA
ncbi:MAG: NAD-dependent epimerase/dehydratase family protein [Candidatus Latescibacterota bacterium]